MRSIILLTTLGLLVSGCATNNGGESTTTTPAPGGGGPTGNATELANGTLSLGPPSVGSLNASVVLPVNVTANGALRVNVTFTQGASVGLRASGLGECVHEFGQVAATGQTETFDCEDVEPGAYDLAFTHDSGSVDFRVVVTMG